MQRPTARHIRKAIGILAAAILGPVLLYLAAALVLGAIPANRGWQEAESGIPIFIRTNGVHTWIVVPKVTPEMDWRPLVPGAHLKDPNWGRGNYVALGYGNRTFYLETPTWGDLTMKNAFLAAFGQGRTLMHADHAHDPQEGESQRRIVLTSGEYRRLSDYIQRSFQRDGAGRTITVPGRGYGRSDAFYEAVGPYSALLTCNEWTGRALRHAGVRTGVWTPMSQSIMWRLD